MLSNATPSQLKAVERSRRFREAIEQKAAGLADRQRPQPVKPAPVAVAPPVNHFEVEPHSNILPPIPNADIAAAAEIAFQEFVPEVRRIQLAVVAEFPSISLVDLLSPRRTEPLVTARQIAMYLAKEITAQSFPEIGRRFGGRDHTTVLHAVRKIKRLITTDAKLAERVARIKQSLTESAL